MCRVTVMLDVDCKSLGDVFPTDIGSLSKSRIRGILVYLGFGFPGWVVPVVSVGTSPLG